jgi:flagellar motor switch protein FliM
MADSERILSQHEVDALLSAIDSGGAEMGADAAALEYDFKRPLRLSRDQLRAFEILQESLARALQPALSGLLRSPVEVRLAGVHQVSLREFLNSLPSPTAATTVRAEPSGHTGVLAVSLLIAFPIVERLLGSPRPAAPPETRPLTTLEWGVLDQAVARVLGLAADTWGGGARVEAQRKESDPAVLPLPDPNDAAVSVAFEVVLGEQRGGLELAFPVRAVERSLGRPAADPSAREGKEALSGRIFPAQVKLTADLPPDHLRLGGLRRLHPGDLLRTGRGADEPVVLSVEGRTKFAGRLGRLKERKAVQVTGTCRPAPPGAAELRGAEGERGADPAVLAQVLSLALPASVVLAEKPSRMREVADLRPGDLIRFERRADGPLELRVARRPVGRGVVVRVGDRFGLRITDLGAGPGRAPVL